MNPLLLLSNQNEEIMKKHDEDIIITTAEGKIIKVTPKSGEHYGLSPSDLLGRSVLELERQGIFSPAITPQVVEKKKKVIMVQKTPSGQKVLITGIPLLNDEFEVEHVISYSYELSELMIMKEYLDELESQISLAKEELAYFRNRQMKIKDFISESPSTRQALKTVYKMKQFDTPVVIYGEHGTGKSILAKTIHNESERKDQPFIEVDCPSIPDAVFEDVLSGTEQSQGYLKLSSGGTLFLKEVDQLSRSSQSILFKLLQHHEDSRVIATSVHSLKEAMQNGNFREDLFYRLHLVSIELKPLRERPEDLSKAITVYLNKLKRTYSRNKNIDDTLFLHLLQLPWNGNFRELKNVVERSFIESERDTIGIHDLPPDYQPTKEEQMEIDLDGKTLPHILEFVEKKVITNAKNRYRTTTEMAAVLGISQPSVVRKLKKYSTTPLGDDTL
ncbi:sigma 54-interacting transcriptional regulator [Jeotgalibacillus sp. ET6]|uniref:sigma 54-interacting transcriptional regulator n=1 Tax=Jeotgalibacillus sp. ET6 TaxID=3037260 RepID=UPI002418BB6D|nr:sigma 54-interacting transcriptional regulator [Jeotgalibacillus sp. ET6]MDG5473239.1 sigma 54-interacting transcriptional regulator [Jeotgalibacillus sp. ET6]